MFLDFIFALFIYDVGLYFKFLEVLISVISKDLNKSLLFLLKEPGKGQPNKNTFRY